MKLADCLKIYDYCSENTDIHITAVLLSEKLDLPAAQVEKCLNTYSSHFVKSADGDTYSLNSDKVVTRDSLIAAYKKSDAKKIGLVFWFLIFFTISISLFTVIISKGG
jgi:hypothetical protein